MDLERLDKLLSASGSFSRSEARVLIRSGAVTVDGISVTNPERKVERSSEIRARGIIVDTERFVYWMMNKPSAFISASKDERWPAVTRLLPDEARRREVFCVGRLDADVTGLLVLTDDGEYAHRVTSPKAQIRKTYEIWLDTPLAAENIRMLSAGVTWTDGTQYRPAEPVLAQDDPCHVFITVTEGKYHEVKRLMAACGREILSMRRISIGGLTLDETLPEGGVRRMTPEEAKRVFHKNV